MRRALFCVVVTLVLCSCSTISDPVDSDATERITISIAPVILAEASDFPAILTDDQFLLMFSTSADLEKIALQRQLTFRAQIYRCRSARDIPPVDDPRALSASTWNSLVYDQGGIVLDVANSEGDDAHHYHAYANGWWWKTSPVDTAPLPPSSLCVRMRGLAGDRAEILSNVVFIPAERMEALTIASPVEFKPGQFEGELNSSLGMFQTAPPPATE